MATTRTDAVNGRVATHVLQGRTDETGTAQTDVDGQDLRVANDLLTGGIGNRADGFQVTETAVAPSMAVDVGSGTVGDIATVEGTDPQQGNYRVSWPDATTEVTVPPSDATNDRIDTIWLAVEDDQFDSSGRTLPALFLIDGTPAGSPTAPGPDANWTAFLKLAEILVPASATEIENADITDERNFSNVTLGGSDRLSVVNTDPNLTRVIAPSGGDVGLTVGTSATVLVDATSLDMRGNDIVNVGTDSPDVRFQPGMMQLYAGSSAPDGWIFCDGQAISRTTFSDLFAAIGVTYGNGNGSTTFNVPDMQSNFPIGQGGGRLLGASGGDFNHTHGAGSLDTQTDAVNVLLLEETGGDALSTEAHTHNVVGSTGAANPPYLVVNFLIKT